MPPAEAMPEGIGERSDEGIRNRVEDQGDQQRRAGVDSGEPEDGVVVEEQESGEAGVLDTLGDLTDSKKELDGKGQSGISPDATVYQNSTWISSGGIRCLISSWIFGSSDQWTPGRLW